jgi:hypothetical protein
MSLEVSNMIRKAPGAHPRLGISLTSSEREREREREHVAGKEKKNGQAIRLLGCPEEKKRKDSFFIPFPPFFFN